jgi:hypothetical protein
MAVSGDLRAEVNSEGSSATFKREADNVLVSYEKLMVMDVKGRAVQARMRGEGSKLVIEVEDAEAEYPLTIDPLLRELTKLVASDGAAFNRFGSSVAISGDTVVVGAPGASSTYVFVRSGTTWTQQAKLVGVFGDSFGGSVAISGDTIIVGANNDDVGGNDGQGSAYVFTRNGTTWTQQAKLAASDGAANDRFGTSVSISGDTVVVGSLSNDVGANVNQGSAYVFTRSGVSWTQQQQLTASDGGPGDLFGSSVAINGDTIIVGASNDDVGGNSGQGSAYVFTRNGTTWMQQQQLTAADGAAGDSFGCSVTISGDTIIVGARNHDVGGNSLQGSAYVFVQSGASWTQQQQLIASDGAAFDNFGISVAISGDTIIVGAFQDDVGGNTDQGSAYIFVCNWTEQPQLTASDGAAPDNFGVSVALSNDTAVIGAMRSTVSASQQGSAYVFVRIGSSWSFQAKLIASDAAASDLFGNTVAISGDTVVVGADLDDVGANGNQGSAYVFVRSGVIWTQQQQLTAADGAANDQFAISVAISSNTVIVGANADDVGANSNQGSAYVFVRSGTTWTQQAQLTASDGAASDGFGGAVAMSGDTVIVGANLDDVGATANQGSAYVFARNGTSWTQQQQLTAADGAANDQFGRAVSMSSDVIAVGASLDDVLANADQGSAYLFTRSGTTWTNQQKILASDGAASDHFGNSISISGDSVVAGANLDDVLANADQGSAYVFMRSGATWYEQQHLTASDGSASDDYGVSVAINGNTILIGADFDDVGANANQGSAYIYFLGCNTVPTAATNNIAGHKGSASARATIANVNDTEDPIGYLSVTVSSAPVGIVITGITNSNGVITAQVAAACNATLGNNAIVLQIQDSDGGVTITTLLINVTANSDPVVGIYPDASVLASNGTTITPGVAPSDNGAIVQLLVSSPTYSGGLSVNSDSGVVTISNARPAGTHIITVTAIDNCGSSASQGFLLTVTCQSITVNPATIPGGTAGTAYSQVFTQTGGLAPVTFSLSGTLPTGLSFTAGTATLSGTPTQVGAYPITITATDRNNCAGSRNYTLTINAPLLVWNGSASNDWHTATNWTPNAVPTSFHDVLIPSAGVTNEPTLTNNSSAINAMTIQAGRTLTINASRQLSTASDLTSAGQINGAGTLVFDGTTFTQNGAVAVASVQFDAGTHALTGGGNFASGIITVLNSATVTLTSSHSVSVIVINSGGVFDATNQTLTLTGAGTPIFNSGTFMATGSTLIYQGAVAQVVTANISYNNLTINNAAGMSLAGDTTASGVLNLMSDLTTGAFTLTMPASGSSTGNGDVIGNVKRTGFVVATALSFGNPLNTIRFDSGSVPSDVNMNLVKSAPAGFPANTVTRTYTITPPGGAGFSATLRLRYKDAELNGLNESTLELWRYNGASWVSPTGGATRDTTNNWVEETGITAFSPWAIAGPTGPTLVELISFTATGYEQGVLLEWQTGLEVDNLGFNVYREADGKRQLLNQQLVAGSALRANSTLLAGESYALFDTGNVNAASRMAAYWLEDVDLAGKSTWHGPFYVASGKPLAAGSYQQQRARSLAQLNNPAAQSDSSAPVQERAGVLGRASLSQINLQTALASQTAIKIAVKREGLYRVPQRALIAAGLDRDADPRMLQLFVDGMEIPMAVSTNKDGQFDENSFIEFYGIGLDTPSTSVRTYWLLAGKQVGKRIPLTAVEGVPSASQSFTQTVERCDRTLYFAALLNGEQENFFGAVITAQSVEQTLNLPGLQSNVSQPATVEVVLQGVTRQPHRVQVQLNNQTLGFIDFSGQENRRVRFPLPHTLLNEGANLARLSSQNGPGDVSLVDRIRISYQRQFVTDNNVLKFQAQAKEAVRVTGFTTKAIRVFDVTNADAPQELAGKIEEAPTGGYSVTVAAETTGSRQLLALSDEQTASPEYLKANQPSALKQAAGADFVVIAPGEFGNAIEPLKRARQGQGLKVVGVDLEDIYDEFNFGHQSPQAIRDFFAYARANWKQPPRYGLFVGDASYDPKNYLGAGENDVVPTKLIDTQLMETASDDWFADFNSDGIGDLAIGRLPVRRAEEVVSLVAKILCNEDEPVSQSVLLVSDANEGFDFEQASAELRELLPAAMRVEEIKRGQIEAGLAKARLVEALANGQKLVNYTGHGNANGWRGNLLTAEAARGLANKQAPVFVLMTCLNGYLQDAVTDSLAEALVKAERGGAVAVWASSGMTTPQEQALMSQALYQELFLASGKATKNAPPVRIGEAIQRAKAATADADIRRTWILLGDPTMRLR